MKKNSKRNVFFTITLNVANKFPLNLAHSFSDECWISGIKIIHFTSRVYANYLKKWQENRTKFVRDVFCRCIRNTSSTSPGFRVKNCSPLQLQLTEEKLTDREIRGGGYAFYDVTMAVSTFGCTHLHFLNHGVSYCRGLYVRRFYCQWLKWGGQGAQPPAPIWAPCNSMTPWLHL